MSIQCSVRVPATAVNFRRAKLITSYALALCSYMIQALACLMSFRSYANSDPTKKVSVAVPASKSVSPWPEILTSIGTQAEVNLLRLDTIFRDFLHCYAVDQCFGNTFGAYVNMLV